MVVFAFLQRLLLAWLASLSLLSVFPLLPVVGRERQLPARVSLLTPHISAAE